MTQTAVWMMPDGSLAPPHYPLEVTPRHEPEDYSQSLLRLYAHLGRADSYRSILEALRPEIERMLGYRSVLLQLYSEDRTALMVLAAGGTVETALAEMVKDERFRLERSGEVFAVVPVVGDRFITAVMDSKDTVVLEDCQTLEVRNRAITDVTGNRTMVEVPLIMADEIVGLLNVGTYFDEGVLVPDEAQLEYLRALANHVAVAMDRVRFLGERREAELQLEEAYGQLQGMFDGVAGLLAHVSSIRDPYTTAHQERVSRLAVAIARDMGLDPKDIDGLRMAATLHDIGKISVPTEILVRPVRLSNLEMGIIKGHPSVACELLGEIGFTHPIATIVRQHHERLDGSGYPDGIRGSEILLESKILAVADVVEAMSADRPYRPALGVEAALKEIERGSGTLYDSDAVAACTRIVRRLGRLP